MKTKQENSYLSHRVLSKFLLKRFTDAKRMIHYYDIEKRTIESAYPKFFNTEPNFFSAEIEDLDAVIGDFDEIILLDGADLYLL